MDKRTILLLTVVLVASVIVSSFLLIALVRLNGEYSSELARLNNELTALRRENDEYWHYLARSNTGEYWYDSNWVTKFIGHIPIESAKLANETYLMLVDKAPQKSYWIIYLPEDNGLPLGLEALEMDSYYKVNGTFRNYAVDCPNAKLVIVYSIYKNGTAILQNVKTVCSGNEYPMYP